MTTFDEMKDLCRNATNHSESELISLLKTATQIDPSVVSERDEGGGTLLHYAAMERSSESCRVIHEQNDTLVKTQNRHGWLPVHCACLHGNLASTKYLLEVYPVSIHIPTIYEEYPLHVLATCHRGPIENRQKLLTHLLKHDIGAVSTPDYAGKLPLHYASDTKALAFVKLLFDAHPDGIFVEDIEGKAPIDIARDHYHADVEYFFKSQFEFYLQTQEDRDPDFNGQLPIHRVLQMKSENVSLGTIKLIVEANPASIAVADIHGCIPLHLACQFGHFDIVKYLADEDRNSLTTLDSGGNLPLHHACLAGKPDIISYILNMTDHDHGVTVRNNAGKLPIQILLFDAICDRDLQYVDAVDSLFRANPVDSLAIICPGLFANTK
eukprot:scaffold97323_cov40-Cyclotella_meneghiniana.AAC.7